jgi:urease accessory protein
MQPLSYLVLATFLIPTSALAHTGVGDTTGLAHGFIHPIGGIDHVLAMVAVGFFAALRGRAALWLMPLAFLTMMAVGGVLGMTGVGLPFVEIGIGLSVVVFGVAVALPRIMPLAAAIALVAFFAVFHGHAHGAEMPDTVSGFEYGIGFVLATALLHLAGIGLGLGIGRMAELDGRRAARLAGGSMAVAGVTILAHLI